MLSKAIAVGVAVLIVLAVWSVGAPALAQQTLTIKLDPPGSKKEADLRLNHETLGATRQNASKQYRVEGRTGSRPNAEEKVIGRIGVISKSKADIKSAPRRKSRTFYSCPKDTYLAIVGENQSWYGVLMADSSTGWVEKKNVSLLDYQVVGKQPRGSEFGSRIVNTALKYLGIRYKWGGYSFDGLDCSGFVKAVFASHGINLPRVSRNQANVGTPLGWNQLQPGDRLYFACKGGQIDHAGIYMGNGLFVHSSRSRGGVVVDRLLVPFYANTLVAARRP